jgi:hypothetical protein
MQRQIAISLKNVCLSFPVGTFTSEVCDPALPDIDILIDILTPFGRGRWVERAHRSIPNYTTLYAKSQYLIPK